MEDIFFGRIYDHNYKKMNKIIYKKNKFYDDEVKHYFGQFKNKIYILHDFCSHEFFPEDYEDGIFYEIYKHKNEDNGEILYKNKMKELKLILDDVEESFDELNNLFRDKYPSIFLE